MARSVWSGTISFGLVNVPVAMFTATREHQPAFHQFVTGGTDRVRYKRVNERTGEEVDLADIVKGVEVGAGELVMIGEDELDQIAPGRSRALEIAAFVALDAIDPIHFNKTYYLAPAAEENKKTYALLREAMARTNRTGIASFVMHGKQHLAAIRPSGDTLVLETLFFDDEVRDPKKMLDNLPGKPTFGKGELDMAERLIESMDDEWEPGRYRDLHTERVKDLIEAKRKGDEVQSAQEAAPATKVVDLLDALRRSVDSARSSTRKAPAEKAPARRPAEKAPARRTATRRTPAKKAPAKKGPAKKAAAKRATRNAS